MAEIRELCENGGQLLTFTAAGETYGFLILDVTDIIEIPEISRIPTAPPHVLGLMNHRGKAVPVMDFRLRLGLPEGEYDDHSCIIVIEINTFLCGIKVDRVRDAEMIQPGEAAVSPAENGVVCGFVTREGKDRISVIDPEILVRRGAS